ncbi:MAG: hypothetical protein ABH950_07650 [Candidatus Altiarchaeota archaeon]
MFRLNAFFTLTFVFLVLSSNVAAQDFIFDISVQIQDKSTIIFHLGKYVTYPWNIATILVLLLFIFVLYNTLLYPLMSPRYIRRKLDPIQFSDINVGGKEKPPTEKPEKNGMSQAESKQVMKEMQMLEKKLKNKKTYAEEDTTTDVWDEIEKDL